MVFDIEEVGGEGLDFNFQINKDQFEINQADLYVNSDIEVNGCLTRVGDDIYLKGKVVTELVMNCSRCLDLLFHSVDSNLKSHFVPSDHGCVSAGEVELHVSDIDKEVYEDHRIDLTQSIRDGILLAVPVVCLCRDDCKGICSQCGKNLNQGSCKCSNESFVDPRLEVLKDFKNKFKEGG